MIKKKKCLDVQKKTISSGSPRYNTGFIDHYVYKLHLYWVLDTSFVNKEDRVKNG
jgi:hypothetical protein